MEKYNKVSIAFLEPLFKSFNNISQNITEAHQGFYHKPFSQ